MIHNSDFLKDISERYSYPEIAVNEFTRIAKRLDSEASFGADFDKIVNDYMFPVADGMDEALKSIRTVSEKFGENEYTMDFMFLLCCAPILKERYAAAEIEEKIFWDTVDDFRCKLKECIDCEEVPGTFVADWDDGFFKMERFAYGRFQYEVKTYSRENDFTASCGKVLRVGEPYVNFHIPSSGVPLTDEVRLASYKEAYGHFKHIFPDGKVIFGCNSWLLYPRHREFLPKNLNILRFMDDFEIVGWEEKEGFPNGWRVFGKASDLPYEQLPRDTTLRRAYADWLSAGNNGGSAFGIIVFDGEKIIR